MSFDISKPRGTTVIEASDFVAPARPVAPVHTPSFKAPKTIGHKPAVIAKAVKAGGPGSGKICAQTGERPCLCHLKANTPENRKKNIKTDSILEHTFGAKGRKLKAGGPGSGRKPEWGSVDKRSKAVLDNMHSDLKKEGYKYKGSSPSGNEGNIFHRYTAPSGSHGGGQAFISQRTNGNHTGAYDTSFSNFPVKLVGKK